MRDFPDQMEPDAELDRLAARVVDAAFAVHRALGPGFTESVYENALAIEFEARQIPFQRQTVVPLSYKGLRIGECRIDFVVGDRLVVELKAVDTLGPVHFAQVTSYLRAARCRLGLLLNFGADRLAKGIRRVILPTSCPSARNATDTCTARARTQRAPDAT